MIEVCDYCGEKRPSDPHRSCCGEMHWSEVDDEEEGTEDEEAICSACSGSGEGQHEGSRCSVCSGRGVIKEEVYAPGQPDTLEERRE